MSENGSVITVREYREDDVPALVSLWSKVFGDEPEFVSEFFRRLPAMGTCVVIERDGLIAAEASVITGMELLDSDSSAAKKCGYIYAVAVDESFRGYGYGVEISREAFRAAKRLGAEIVCTLPASDSLYDFYNKALQFECSLYRERKEAAAFAAESAVKISAGEYASIRKALLKRPYMQPSPAVMEFTEKLCESYGGGLFRTESGICTAQSEADRCILHELICSRAEDAAKAAGSVAAALGCSRADYYVPAEKGEKYISAEPRKIFSSTFWGIAFE